MSHISEFYPAQSMRGNKLAVVDSSDDSDSEVMSTLLIMMDSSEESSDESSDEDYIIDESRALVEIGR